MDEVVLQGVAGGDFHADEGLFQGDIELDVLYDDGGGFAFGELDANGQGGLLVGPDGEVNVGALDVEANGFLTVDFLFAEVLYISVRIVLHFGDNVADGVQLAAINFLEALDVIVACDFRDPKADECEHSGIFKIEDHGRVHVGHDTSDPGVEDLGLVYVGHGSSDPGAYDDVVHFESVGAFAYDVVEDDGAGVEDWLDDVGEGDCSACELADAYNGRECDDGCCGKLCYSVFHDYSPYIRLICG